MAPSLDSPNKKWKCQLHKKELIEVSADINMSIQKERKRDRLGGWVGD
jgi:hypothetical protein